MTSCSVIFTSSLGCQDYTLAQICCNKERRKRAHYGVLGKRDEAWFSDLMSDNPAKLLRTRQSNPGCCGHAAAAMSLWSVSMHFPGLDKKLRPKFGTQATGRFD